MSEQTDNTPGSANAILPTVGFGGVKGFEQVEVKGNRLDNPSETWSQTRQILSYRSRWSDTFSDAVLWVCSSGALSRMMLIAVRNGVPPIYPWGIFGFVCIIGFVVSLDTVKRYPNLAPSFGLRGAYIVCGLLSTVI